MPKQKIISLLTKATNLPKEQVINLLETPPSSDLGDFSFPCFILSNPKDSDSMWKNVEKDFFTKKNPAEIASHLKDKLTSKKLPKEIEKIETKGPYLNFFINKQTLAEEVIKIGDNYGKGKIREKVTIEFPGPNTNKPLHLGHLRNMSIGESVSRILEFSGNKVIRVNINNDRGIHICKSMLAYQKWGKNKEPNKKSDHFVGDFYVLYNEKLKQYPELEKEVRELLRKWENKDKETIKLWKKMNKWAFDGFNETYKKFGIKIDKEFYESETYELGKQIVKNELKKGVFEEKSDGAVIINLKNQGLGEKVLLRSDGTTVYITQDLYLAELRHNEFKPDSMIYVVGNEQDYHFQILQAILKKLNLTYADKVFHLSHGMVNLPEGKMKSREGTKVDADDLISEMQKFAKKGLEKRTKLNKKQLEERSLKIALSAIKYFLLKVDVEKNMIFNPKESLDFEGNTGPYLQYSYARASSIIKKAKSKSSKTKIPELTKSEMQLIKLISLFPDKVQTASKHLSPHVIATYSYDLAKSFNEFYHNCPVIKAKPEQKAFRLKLVDTFRKTLKNSLYLLGIEVMDEM